jgi:nucleoid-associated protein YgaU
MASRAVAPSGSLAKLQIKAFLDIEYRKLWSDGTNPVTVGINPASYAQSQSIRYTPDKAAGGKNQPQIFNRPGEASLKLELILDGTGAVPGASVKSVDEQIFDLRKILMQIDGLGPHYLMLLWGTLVFRGRAESLEINCTLFNPDGTPLRAKANANFIGVNMNKKGKASTAKGPDGPTSATLLDGDTLPAMCERLYGDSKYYIAVAAANGLTSFRDIKPGSPLIFPSKDELKYGPGA